MLAGVWFVNVQVIAAQVALEICPEYHPLFLTALRAGLRRGELVAVQWGDIQFGKDEQDPNRFIVVEHYVKREHTTTKSKKSRRVDMSRELKRVLIELRDKRLLESFLKGYLAALRAMASSELELRSLALTSD